MRIFRCQRQDKYIELCSYSLKYCCFHLSTGIFKNERRNIPVQGVNSSAQALMGVGACETSTRLSKPCTGTKLNTCKSRRQHPCILQPSFTLLQVTRNSARRRIWTPTNCLHILQLVFCSSRTSRWEKLITNFTHTSQIDRVDVSTHVLGSSSELILLEHCLVII